MKTKILTTILLLNLLLLPLAVAQSTTSSETIQISPTQTSSTTTCPVGCICEGKTTTCPVVQPPVCDPPCIKSGDNCVCSRICPVGCICEGKTTTCPTIETKPTITTVETLTGTETIQVKKIEDKLQIESGKTSANSKETFVIEESKLYITTSSGNKQIKVLPEEASSKAKVTTVKEIELKEEASVPVYSVKGTKEAKILAIIPISLEIETKVSAESGEIVSISKPWWSFLAW